MWDDELHLQSLLYLLQGFGIYSYKTEHKGFIFRVFKKYMDDEAVSYETQKQQRYGPARPDITALKDKILDSLRRKNRRPMKTIKKLKYKTM